MKYVQSLPPEFHVAFKIAQNSIFLSKLRANAKVDNIDNSSQSVVSPSILKESINTVNEKSVYFKL